ERARTESVEFLTIFGEEYAKIPDRKPLAAIFYTPERKDMFDREGSDASILDALRKEASNAVDNTERIMRTRIDKFGVAQPSIQKQQFSGRIQIELPGVKDKERVRRVLQSTANLEFWETYENEDVYPVLERINSLLADRTAAGKPTATATDSTATEADATLADATEVSADSTAADSAATTEEDFAVRNPLFNVFTPAVFQTQGGGFSLMRGSVVGSARLSDTAMVNNFLADPAVRKLMPNDLKLAWS